MSSARGLASLAMRIQQDTVRLGAGPPQDADQSDTKTQPIPYEAFAECLAWWGNRVVNEQAWRVPAAEILANNCNLDRKNPNAAQDLEHLPPEQLVLDIMEKEKRIAELMLEIQQMLK